MHELSVWGQKRLILAKMTGFAADLFLVNLRTLKKKIALIET